MPSKTLSLSLLLFTSTTLALSEPSLTPSPSPAHPKTHCPPAHEKQCCASLHQPTEDLTGALGQVVPILSGLDVSSLIGVGCTPVAERYCGDDVMCCRDGSAGGLTDGAVKFCQAASEENVS